jgi:hypothetical protein
MGTRKRPLRITPEERYDRGGSINLGKFDSCMGHFLFLVLFISLDARIQCCNRLGVGVSSGQK